MKPQVLVVGVSSRALFDMEEANRVFETEGVEAYARYQMKHQDAILALALHRGFPHAKLIDTIADRLERLIHRV